MTTLPFGEGNASEFNPVEDYASEDYSDWTEAAAPDSNLLESVFYDAIPDAMIDQDVPAHAAATLVAENAMEQLEQSVLVDAMVADMILALELALESPTIGAENAMEQLEQSVLVDAVVADMILELELALEEEEDTMSEWCAEVDGDMTSECPEDDESWVESEDEDMIIEGFEEAGEDETWVASEEGFQTMQDSVEANALNEEENALLDVLATWLAGEDATIENSALLQAYLEANLS